MKDDTAAFVAELIELAQAREHTPDDSLHAVVRRLHDHQPGWDWVGVYLLVGNTLVLGPYVGEATEHVRIAVGLGVCGTAVQLDTNMLVDDVRTQDNYLACSFHTRSEIVVLIRDRGEVVGQFDVDSDRVAAFSQEDERLLEQLAAAVSATCRAARDARVAHAAPV